VIRIFWTSWRDSWAAIADGGDDPDDSELGEEEEAAPPKTRRAGVAAAYARAARSQARSTATRRSIGEATRTGRLIDWLRDRLPGEEDVSKLVKAWWWNHN